VNKISYLYGVNINNVYKEIVALKAQVASLNIIVNSLKKENAILKDELKKCHTIKNSRNSSIPPSKDENRPKPNQSLRTSSGKKPGGQKGHKGATLKPSDNPDEIVKLIPDFCTHCGNSLFDIIGIKKGVRQIIDIPEIKPIYKEYQVFSKTCNCGHVTASDFPKNVNAPISYGENIEGHIAFFYARHYLPFDRMKKMFNNVFNIDISEGGLHYLLNKFVGKAHSTYEQIRNKVQLSSVIGSDETGVKVNGNKHWFWTWQTDKLTFIAHSDKRGGIAINENFPNGFPNATLVHDGWKPQINTPANLHQLCLAHLQRDLKYLNQLYPKNNWGNSFLKLLYDSLQVKRKMNNENYNDNHIPKMNIYKRLKQLLTKPPPFIHKKLLTFYNRMIRDEKYLFTFLEFPNVPPDNNASERAIRNVKVKQKISGQFKTASAAHNFAIIRSVIDTILKNNQNVLKGLATIAKFA
jgi:transposase